MISLLITILVAVVVGWLIVYLMSQMPGIPSFFPAIVWVVVVLVILFAALRLFGYSAAGIR